MIQSLYMKLLVLACLSLFAALGEISAQDQRWDLQRCVEYGMKNNINVRLTTIQADRSQINYDQSKLAALPTLGYGLSHGFSLVEHLIVQQTSTQAVQRCLSK